MRKFTPLFGAMLLASMMLVSVACSGGDDDDDDTTPEPEVSATEAAPTLEPSPTPTSEPSPSATPDNGAVVTLKLPEFDVSSDIEDIGLIPGTNQMATPENPLNTGWYSEYGTPGWMENSVFSAHVDYYPDIIGPFNRLTEMENGDQVVVVMEDGTEYTYEVFETAQYEAATIPMGDLIWPTDIPEDEEWITLITCGGDFQPFNGESGPGEYVHRDVVIAKRVG